MKSVFMFFVCVFMFSFGQAQISSSKKNLALIINGKEIRGTISKENVGNLCSLQIKFIEIDKTFDATYFSWVVSSGNELCRGDCGIEKLFPPEKLKTLKRGDVLIIDEIKIAEDKIDVPGQFTFLVQ